MKRLFALCFLILAIACGTDESATPSNVIVLSEPTPPIAENNYEVGSIPEIEKPEPPRLEGPHYNDDGECLGWYDTKLGIYCSFYIAADGEARCLPDYTEGYLLSGDGVCDGRTYIGIATINDSTTPRYIGVWDYFNRLHIYKIESELAENPIAIDQGRQCNNYSISSASVEYSLWSVSEVPASEFAK